MYLDARGVPPMADGRREHESDRERRYDDDGDDHDGRYDELRYRQPHGGEARADSVRD